MEDSFLAEIVNKKRIALVAHDARKPEMLDWVQTHQEKLSRHVLFGTGTTGSLIMKATGLALLYNIPTASNRSTADFLIASPFMDTAAYTRRIPNYLGRLEVLHQESIG